jgi:hypothetical protein
MWAVDVDGGEFGDIIALKPNEQYWYEAADKNGNRWLKTRIGSLPIDDHLDMLESEKNLAVIFKEKVITIKQHHC